jgi:hypothetical protein
MRITYNYFESQTQREEVERALTPLLSILPYWVETIAVERYARGEDESADASVACMAQYRWMRIEVYHRLFDNPPEKIREMLAHEVCHALVAPLACWMRDRVIRPLFDGSLKTVLEAECEERVEAVVQDLALSLGRRPNPYDRPVDSDTAKLRKAEEEVEALKYLAGELESERNYARAQLASVTAERDRLRVQLAESKYVPTDDGPVL